MKSHRYLLFITISFLSLNAYAQTNKKTLNYQAVILDPKAIDIPGASITGQPLNKGNVCLRFSLLNAQGGLDYEETQQVTTDEFGLVSVAIGTGSQAQASNSTSVYNSFESIVWNASVKSLKVSVSYDGCSSFKQVSTQVFNYTPYALYAESVDYKNVRDAPTKLSQFSNDAGYLIPKDLDPLKTDIQSNSSKIATANQNIADNKQASDAAFLVVNQSISSLDKQVAENTNSITTINTKLTEQQNQIVDNRNQITATNNTMNAQIGGLQGQLNITNSTVSNLSGVAEMQSNKSTAINLGGANPSDQAYPSQRATKAYVDNAIYDAVGTGVPDATTLAAGKVKLSGDLGGTAMNPTVPALAGKENTTNKSINVVNDGGSDTKYPSVKAVKDYVDAATYGTALAADLANKANIISPAFQGVPTAPTPAFSDNSTKLATTAFVQTATAGIALQTAVDAKADKESPALTGVPTAPTAAPNTNTTQIATTAFVTASLAAGAPEATTTSTGKVQLAGDLGGTATAPTVPGLALKANTSDVTSSLALKEDVSRKSTATDLGATSPSDVFYPSQKAVKTYVDAQVASATIADADAATKGKLKLAGDLGGTADAPTVPGLALKANATDVTNSLALKAPIESPTFTGTVGGITKLMVGLANVDNTTDANKPVSTAAQTALDLKENASNKSDNTSLGTSTTLFPTQNAVKTYVDAQIASGAPDATTSTTGKIQLAGDLTGFATSPTIATGVITSAKITDETIVNTDISTTAAIADTKLATIATPGKVSNSATTATADNTASAIVARDGSGNFTAGTITANLTGNVTGNITGTAANVTSTVAVANGGTGATTLTGYVKGSGTSAMTASASIPVADVTGAQTSANLSVDIAADAASTTKYPAVKSIKDYVDASLTSGAPNATTSATGKIQLAGDLAGLNSSATVPVISNSAINTDKLAADAVTSAKILDGEIVNADINSSAAIADSKLATIATTGKVSNSATTATAGNTASAIVARDGSGNFTAGTITANLTGNVTGNISGTAANVTGTVAVANGGTGATSLTGYVKGSGTSAMTASASIPVADVTGAAPIASPTFTGTVTSPIYASAPQNLTDGATISWNPTNGLNAGVTLGGNRTLSLSPAPASGSYGTLVITQDGTGGRTLTLPSKTNRVLGSTSTTTVALSSAANAKDILNFYFDGTTYFWNIGQGYGTAATITANNIAGGAAGSLPYQTGAGATGFLAKGSDGQILTLASGLPIWSAAPATGVTSVAMSTPTGLSITGSPITSTGTLALSLSTGYAIPTTTSQTNWDAAYTNRITSATSPLSISSNALSLGTVAVANGGTGATTLTGYLKGSGTSAMTASASIPVADVTGAQTSANLSVDIAADSASTTKYPAVKSIKAYVDASVTSGAPDANATTKGKIQLAGDLAGTSSSALAPIISNLAISTAKLAADAVTSAKILDGEIVNADISSTAEIADTKLATIVSQGKVSNSATTATDENTASAIVARDGSGNFNAGTITANLTGLASKATNINGGVIGAIPYQSAPNTTTLLTGNTEATKKFLTQTGDGSAASAPVWEGVAVSDITGTLPVANGGTGVTTTAANLVFAGPTSGATPAAPSFRALVAADLPTGSTNYVNNGTTQQANTSFNISGAGTVGTTFDVTGNTTIGGTATITGATKISSLTASKGVFTDASKNLTSTGTLGTEQGGTGLASFNDGGAMYATSNSALTTGTLPTSAGGTGLTSYSSGGALYTTSTTAITSGTLPLTAGGTGATSATAALTALGAAPLASPTFTGTVTAPIYASAPQNLTDAATISWNPTSGLNAGVTLGGNRTLSFSPAPASGSYGTLVITQDGTGGRTLTLPSGTNKVLGSTSTTAVALSSAANAKDILNFYFDGTTYFWNIGQGYGSAATITANNIAGGAAGSIPYQTGAGATGFLAKGADGQILTLASGVPSWTAASATGVTSVAMTTPTGLTVSGSPISSTGTLALSLSTGYEIPTTTSQTNWNTAYTNRITSATSPLTISSNAISLGTVPVASGGTGVTTAPTNGQILIGNGTGFALATLTAGTGVSITNGGGSITINASARSWTDQPTVTANQTAFTLTYAPTANSKIWMFINGVRTNNNAYSFSGTTVTYVPANNGAYAILANDRVQFDYTY